MCIEVKELGQINDLATQKMVLSGIQTESSRLSSKPTVQFMNTDIRN